ncbi:uncharacterized protein G2W53_035304 [Senna tora]|uniref:Uncharacterized protein n=1 Tax=Senna tora TaxID=362788 RepID=A0A834SSD3_9FABA|nr:uncharacterized protein G2W53_035304 [Senna tora]
MDKALAIIAAIAAFIAIVAYKDEQCELSTSWACSELVVLFGPKLENSKFESDLGVPNSCASSRQAFKGDADKSDEADTVPLGMLLVVGGRWSNLNRRLNTR